MSVESQVGKLDIVLNADATRVSAAVDQVNQKLDQMTQKARSSSQSVASSNAGLVDSFSGIGEGVRRIAGSIDQLGSKTDEIMGKQHTAWLAIGTVVGGTTQSMIEKVTAFIDKVSQIPGALENAMRSMDQDAWSRNDALRVTNDELENQIAIIEKTPQNNLALGLDEARVRADALAASIQLINDRTEKALSENHIAGWKRLLGVGPTANVEGTINSFNQQIADAANQRQVDLHDGLPMSAAQDDQDRRALLAAAHKKYQEELGRLKDGKYDNNSANRSMLLLADAQVVNEQDADKEGDRNQTDKDRLKRDQDAQRAREAAQAAQQKADQQQMAAFRQQLSALQQNHKLALGEELAFWQERLNDTQQGSANYIAIYEKLGALSQAMLEKMDAQILEKARKRAAEIKQWDEEAIRLSDELDRAARQSADNLASYNDTVSKNADAMREMTVSHDVATGAITRHDAAVKMAGLHAADYAAQLKKLDDERKADYDDASLTPEQRQANDMGRQNKAAEITGQRDRTALQDSLTIQQSTAMGGLTQAFDELIAASNDVSAEMHDLASSTIKNLNSTLLTLLTTPSHGVPRHLWANFGKTTATSVADSALKKGEGMLLSGLGFGAKADGSSQSNALWVRMAGGLGSAAGAVGNVLSPLASSASQSSGFLAGAGKALMTALPFFGDGGDFNANSMAIVGERGPELVRFGRSGSVTSNDDLAGLGAGDVHHHWNIDARGASDPAQIKAAVQRGIAEAAPHIMAGSVKAMQEHQARRPSISR
jgi:hypothetical protein